MAKAAATVNIWQRCDTAWRAIDQPRCRGAVLRPARRAFRRDPYLARALRVDVRTMTDRRRWPRFTVTWSVELFVADSKTLATTTIDASRYGLRLAVSRAVAAQLLRPGESYRVEVRLPGSQAKFVRFGEVCDIGEHGVGLWVLEALPAAIVQPAAAADATCRVASGAASPPPLQPVRSVMAMLRALSASRR